MKPVIVITRPKDGAARFEADLRQACAAGIRIVISPLFIVEHLTPDIAITDAVDFVFTSESGVDATTALIGDGQGRRAFCVGARTALAARAAGFEPLSANGDLAALVDLIVATTNRPLVYLRGENVAGDLVAQLAALGHRCTDHIVYRQVDVPLSEPATRLLQSGVPVLLPVFSTRSAHALLRALPDGRQCHVVAISNAVASEFRDARFSVRIAECPDQNAMVTATCAQLRQLENAKPA